MILTPQKYFLVAGNADDIAPLSAFDKALLASGIGNTNLIKVSSILPPGAAKIEIPIIPPGSILPVAYASITSNIPDELIAAAVAVAIPQDNSLPGVIMEYSTRGHSEDADRVVRMVAERAMKNRGCAIACMDSLCIQHRVEKMGAAFAAVALWW